MEKTILIDGKEVKFKSTGATPLRYKAQFNEDFFKVITKMQKIATKDGEISEDALEHLDFEMFYRIAWIMAKTADNTISDPISWLDEFDSFPIFEIIGELTEMIVSTLEAKKK